MGGNVLLRLMDNRQGLAPHGITEPVLAFALMAAVHPRRLSMWHAPAKPGVNLIHPVCPVKAALRIS
jgi:hypothetical protein